MDSLSAFELSRFIAALDGAPGTYVKSDEYDIAASAPIAKAIAARILREKS